MDLDICGILVVLAVACVNKQDIQMCTQLPLSVSALLLQAVAQRWWHRSASETARSASGWPTTHPFNNLVLPALNYPTYGSLRKAVNDQSGVQLGVNDQDEDEDE